MKGDSKVFSIAAASILAKVTRDRLMNQHAETYPKYGFDQHKVRMSIFIGRLSSSAEIWPYEVRAFECILRLSKRPLCLCFCPFRFACILHIHSLLIFVIRLLFVLATNDHNTCAIRATVWQLMSLPSMRTALAPFTASPSTL